jgi:hypothetical protein
MRYHGDRMDWTTGIRSTAWLNTDVAGVEPVATGAGNPFMLIENNAWHKFTIVVDTVTGANSVYINGVATNMVRTEPFHELDRAGHGVIGGLFFGLSNGNTLRVANFNVYEAVVPGSGDSSVNKTRVDGADFAAMPNLAAITGGQYTAGQFWFDTVMDRAAEYQYEITNDGLRMFGSINAGREANKALNLPAADGYYVTVAMQPNNLDNGRLSFGFGLSKGPASTNGGAVAGNANITLFAHDTGWYYRVGNAILGNPIEGTLIAGTEGWFGQMVTATIYLNAVNSTATLVLVNGGATVTVANIAIPGGIAVPDTFQILANRPVGGGGYEVIISSIEVGTFAPSGATVDVEDEVEDGWNNFGIEGVPFIRDTIEMQLFGRTDMAGARLFGNDAQRTTWFLEGASSGASSIDGTNVLTAPPPSVPAE